MLHLNLRKYFFEYFFDKFSFLEWKVKFHWIEQSPHAAFIIKQFSHIITAVRWFYLEFDRIVGIDLRIIDLNLLTELGYLIVGLSEWLFLDQNIAFILLSYGLDLDFVLLVHFLVRLVSLEKSDNFICKLWPIPLFNFQLYQQSVIVDVEVEHLLHVKADVLVLKLSKKQGTFWENMSKINEMKKGVDWVVIF